MTTRGFFIVLLVFSVGVALGWCSRERTLLTERVEVVDTIRYYAPQPYTAPRFDNLYTPPRLLFAPKDTVVYTRVDSVEVAFRVEQREYRDSTYRAIVSGAVVGERRPTLDYIETYERTTTSTVVIPPKKVRLFVGGGVGIGRGWSVSLGGGVLLKDHHAIGVEYERTTSDNLARVRYSYLF